MTYRQSLKIGLYSVQRFTTITQSRRELTNFCKLPVELTPYGKTSIILNAINCWNKIQNMLGGHLLKSLHPAKIKNIITQKCINKYQ